MEDNNIKEEEEERQDNIDHHAVRKSHQTRHLHYFLHALELRSRTNKIPWPVFIYSLFVKEAKDFHLSSYGTISQGPTCNP